MDENIFFDQGGVSVSNARFIVRGKTFAMNGVTSVKKGVDGPTRLGPVVLGVIGTIALLRFTTNGIIWGVVLLGAAIFWWTQQKPTWTVVLSSSSGETQALSSDDKAFIDGVIEALNQSIVHRG